VLISVSLQVERKSCVDYINSHDSTLGQTTSWTNRLVFVNWENLVHAKCIQNLLSHAHLTDSELLEVTPVCRNYKLLVVGSGGEHHSEFQMRLSFLIS